MKNNNVVKFYPAVWPEVLSVSVSLLKEKGLIRGQGVDVKDPLTLSGVLPP